MTVQDWPDTVSGENIVHLLKIGRAIHDHLLVQLDINGHTRQHTLNKSCPVETLQDKYIIFLTYLVLFVYSYNLIWLHVVGLPALS